MQPRSQSLDPRLVAMRLLTVYASEVWIDFHSIRYLSLTYYVCDWLTR
jgi:hypothetical protein